MARNARCQKCTGPSRDFGNRQLCRAAALGDLFDYLTARCFAMFAMFAPAPVSVEFTRGAGLRFESCFRRASAAGQR